MSFFATLLCYFNRHDDQIRVARLREIRWCRRCMRTRVEMVAQ